MEVVWKDSICNNQRQIPLSSCASDNRLEKKIKDFVHRSSEKYVSSHFTSKKQRLRIISDILWPNQ